MPFNRRYRFNYILRLLFVLVRTNIQNVMVAVMALQHNLGALQQCMNRDQQATINALTTQLADRVHQTATAVPMTPYPGCPRPAVPASHRIPTTPISNAIGDSEPAGRTVSPTPKGQKRPADLDWDKGLGYRKLADGGSGPDSDGGAGGGGGSESSAIAT